MTFQDDGDASDVDDADLCTDYGKGVFHGNVLDPNERGCFYFDSSALMAILTYRLW